MLYIPDTDSISPLEKIVNDTLGDTLSKATKLRNDADGVRRNIVQYLLSQGKYEQARSVESCGTFLMFKSYNDALGTSTLERANFCKHPLCPTCAWRRHIKYSAILSHGLQSASGKLSHLVLAVPNSAHLSRGDLMRLKERAKTFVQQKLSCKNYISNLEIVASDAGYHPHLHILLETDTYYKVNAEWIKRMATEWKKHFSKKREELYANYDSFTFYITGITRENMSGAVQELTKYIIKGQQKISADMIAETAEAIHGVRKMSSAGTLKDTIKTGKRLATLALDDKLAKLSRYEWEYHIYQFIHGCYERKMYTDDNL